MSRSWIDPKALAVVLVLAVPAAALADEPDANAIIRSLAPITYLPEHGGPPKRSIDLEVQFKVNSAALTPNARRTLDVLGAALNDAKLASSRFEIVGHTDASGSRAHNQTLSERRAKAVVDYLARVHKVARKRLAALGKGEDALKDPLRPRATENRRVEIVNLTPVRVQATPAAIDVQRKSNDILTGK
ncbi:MAG: OmpA family protein [Alphaproteobacteria bacterium]|jgi:outer membrane protein OmpA-like peptidoglycan-associated protein|nr:OmpA family protein [Alphaproteobacteria bacterium]